MNSSVMGLSVEIVLPKHQTASEIYERVKAFIQTIDPTTAEINLLYVLPERATIDVSFDIKSEWSETR